MWPFYILILIIFTGFAIVMKLIWDEHRKEPGEKATGKKERVIKPADVLERSGLKPATAAPSKKSMAVSAASSFALFEKLKARIPIPGGKKSPFSDAPKSLPDPDTTTSANDIPKTGTASIRLDPKSGKTSIQLQKPEANEPQLSVISQQSQKPASIKPATEKANLSIDREVELSIANDELKNQLVQIQERYDKLDKLFLEKSETLEKTLKDLEHEQKNRKEFNKVKDLLEKEIKDSKTIAKKAEAELNSIKSESGSYTTRITQLEEKIKKLEGELYSKEDLLEEQRKKISEFSSTATAKPPLETAAPSIPQENPVDKETATPALIPPAQENEAAITEPPQEIMTAEESPQPAEDLTAPVGKQHTPSTDIVTTKEPKKTGPIEISASPEYLSLLGDASLTATSSAEEDDPSSQEEKLPLQEQEEEQPTAATPPAQLQNENDPPEEPDHSAEQQPSPTAPDVGPEAKELTTLSSLDDQEDMPHDVEKLLLKPISPTTETPPATTDDTGGPSDLPEIPLQEDSQSPVLPETPDDLPAVIKENGGEESPAALEIEQIPAAEEEQIDEEYNIQQPPPDNDPSRPHLNPDIFKDIHAEFEEENNEKSQTENHDTPEDEKKDA